MRNLSIERKLLVICGAVGLVILAMAVGSLWQMSAMNEVAMEIQDDHVPQALLADAMNTATSDYEAALQSRILARSPGDIAAAERRAAAALDVIAKSQAKVLGTDLDDSERRYLDGFKRNWTRYEASGRQVLAQARDGNIARASGIIVETMPIFGVLSQNLADFSAYQRHTIEAASAHSRNAYRMGMLGSVVALIAAIAALGFALLMMSRLVSRPLALMSQALGELANGQLDAAVPVEVNADEVGDLARAMVRLRDQLVKAETAKREQADMLVGTVGTALGGLARGDLTTRIEADLTEPFTSLKTDFNAAAASLAELVQEVSANARDIDTSAAEIRFASDDLARRTEQQAHSLEATASSLDSISATVSATADSAGSAAQAMHAANDEAIEGGIVVKRAMEAMTEIESSTDKVNRIVDVIDGIAFQTNLLALNAGVEAARAGDAGKGFAVVATEVRALAQRSADAARDIKTLIGESNQRVVDGVTLVSDTGALLGRIVERITAMTSMIGGIADSSQGQAAQIGAVNTTIGEMDRTTQQNAAMVEETTAAARSLASKAAALTNIVSRFRTGAGQPAPAANREKAAEPTVRRAAPAPVTHGNLALASDDWSEF